MKYVDLSEVRMFDGWEQLASTIKDRAGMCCLLCVDMWWRVLRVESGKSDPDFWSGEHELTSLMAQRRRTNLTSNIAAKDVKAAKQDRCTFVQLKLTLVSEFVPPRTQIAALQNFPNLILAKYWL